LDSKQESRRCNVDDRNFDHVGPTKARVDFPEKGTTPESGGGTATQSRAVVTTATLASLPILSHPDACAKENRDTQAVPPQSLERVRNALLASHPR
jgi:hypothetical protein